MTALYCGGLTGSNIVHVLGSYNTCTLAGEAMQPKQ